MKRISTLLLITLFTVVGCKSKKKSAVDEVDPVHMDVIPAIEQANPVPKFVNARGKGSFKGMGINQGFKIDLRHQRDSIIWLDVSAAMLGIKVARIMITPDSVMYYNKLNKTYLSSTVSDLQKLVQGPIGFADLQAVLTGKPLSYPHNLRRLKKEQGAWVYAVNSSHRLVTLRFDADDYLLLSQEVHYPKERQMLSTFYSNNDDIIPSNLIFSSFINGEDVELIITFDKIENQSSITYPFSIPSGYESL